MSSSEDKFTIFINKMTAAGLDMAAIAAFKHSYSELIAGAGGCISENTINPVEKLVDLDRDIRSSVIADTTLLKETVVVKLNGGLGTSMGLDKAKSLLDIKDNNTFLDLTAKQIINLRNKYNMPIEFMLMNSFNTSDDTLKFLERKYKTSLPLSNNNMKSIELMQNKVPKVNKSTLLPVEYNINKHLEWCPPGHGDIYTALYGSGKLEYLINKGIKYMFVSNSDNLGATLDLELLTYFANSNKSFLMECCQRTEADKKGGHLALRSKDNRLLLRESAQCAKEDSNFFQDINRHQYFNTSNFYIFIDLFIDLFIYLFIDLYFY